MTDIFKKKRHDNDIADANKLSRGMREKKILDKIFTNIIMRSFLSFKALYENELMEGSHFKVLPVSRDIQIFSRDETLDVKFISLERKTEDKC